MLCMYVHQDKDKLDTREYIPLPPKKKKKKKKKGVTRV